MTRCSATSARATATRRTPSSAKRSPRTRTPWRTSFRLFDNFYDDGRQSADGHNWLVQADSNDYNEWNSERVGPQLPRTTAATRWPTSPTGSCGTRPNGRTRRVANYGEYEPFTGGHAVPRMAGMSAGREGHTGQDLGAPLDVPLNPYKFYSDVPSLNAISNQAYPRLRPRNPRPVPGRHLGTGLQAGREDRQPAQPDDDDAPRRSHGGSRPRRSPRSPTTTWRLGA